MVLYDDRSKNEFPILHLIFLHRDLEDGHSLSYSEIKERIDFIANRFKQLSDFGQGEFVHIWSEYLKRCDELRDTDKLQKFLYQF